MSKDEIAKKLNEFADYLNIASIFSDPFRWLAWIMVKGIAFFVDGLEKVTDEVLLIRRFFQNPEIVAFVDSIRPFLYILLAFSLLYTGYLLIFQKKFNREGIAINLFIALAVVALLGTGMEKANDFTDEAIKAVKTDHLYQKDDNASLSDTIIQRNVTDLVMFDKNGWSTTELDSPNDFPPSKAKNISIKQRFTKDDMSEVDIKLSSESDDISKHFLVLGEGGADKIAKFDQSGLEWNNEYYYRYDVDWFTLLTTMIVMAFTLFSIAYKLARLSFELAFNYVLAIIIAPADVHDGQKTKKILQSIFNTFLVIILIFLSMKIYMIGTGVIADQLDGMAYLIALIAFSVAVIDGPNIVERLFGIDAGLKSGWGVLAGAYAGARMVSGTTKGLANMGNALRNRNGNGNGTEGNNVNGNMGVTNSDGNKPPSPNDKDKSMKPKNQEQSVAFSEMSKGENQAAVTTESGQEQEEKGRFSGSGGAGSIAQLAEAQQQGNRRNTVKAPSPNDIEHGGLAQQVEGQGTSKNEVPISNGSVTSSKRPISVQSGFKGVTAMNDSQSLQKAQDSVQKASVQTDTSITGIEEQTQGNASVSSVQSGSLGATTSIPVNAQNSTGNTPITSDSHSVQNVQGVQKSSVQTDVEVSNMTEQVQGKTTTSTTQTGSSSSQNVTPTNVSSISNSVKNVNGSRSVETTKVVQNSTVQSDLEVASTTEQVQGGTVKTNTNTVCSDDLNSIKNQSYERKRPRTYSIGSNSENTIKKIKSYKKKRDIEI